ncbi:MAG: cation transporter [Clostridiales bacterium]|jgi:cation diffusion facilitator family transporter|nr:cation transporter [Clostridiales bacterium]
MVSEERYLQSMAGARTGVFVNLLLVIVKIGAGIFAGSLAMMADALHSAADIVASAVVYVGIRVASRPADEDHPYGHGKAESIASKIVAILVILAGLNIGFFSLRTLFRPEHSAPGAAALWAALFSIFIKEGLFRHTFKIGQAHSCKVLIANAYEHRSDAFSSVAALLGIGGARLGLIFNRPQLFLLDPLAGVIVSVFIVRMGWHFAKEAASELMDGQADPAYTNELTTLILAVDGVYEIHSIRVRVAGPHQFVNLEIGVDEAITVREGHDVAQRVKETLVCEKEEIAEVFIHVNPCRTCDT